MADQLWTTESFPKAVARLFGVNNYSVEESVHIFGAEVDLVATPVGNHFSPKVYIEATIQYVDNEKYGKDVGKLALIAVKDPAARKLIVSSRGFSPAVVERARETGIETLTYSELFSRFEKFEPYIDQVIKSGEMAVELAHLESIYVEPQFVDSHGRDLATGWLTEWHRGVRKDSPWLIVVGDYGTGKTALTKVLTRRWTRDHSADAGLPLVFRIELRDFARQFDANGLLHHFLDRNALGHVPIDFVWTLIRTGRVTLLLDGYDEMAQYLSMRERRACLEALAHLSAGGARGLMTSRPNYFSEAEEFHLFDVLYRDLEVAPLAAGEARLLSAREAELDDLIGTQLLDRHERSLEDLSPEQTEGLVHSVLENDPSGANVIVDILRRVFRTNDGGSTHSLAGKPVIVSYLLDVVEQLKAADDDHRLELTEWDVYTLVLDKLMLRDMQQAGRVPPKNRRRFLQRLAVELSRRDTAVIDEERFRDLIAREFRKDLSRFDAEQRRAEMDNYFEDLRRSGTLTRSSAPGMSGWKFSHNSLKEFMLSEKMVSDLCAGEVDAPALPVTDAMRAFARSQPPAAIAVQAQALARMWPNRQNIPAVGKYVQLLWDAVRLEELPGGTQSSMLDWLTPGRIELDRISLERLQLSSPESPLVHPGGTFKESVLSGVSFAAARIERSNFADSLLEGVDFAGADLTECDFAGAILFEVILTGASVEGANFRGIDPQSSVIVSSEGVIGATLLSGPMAIGYLKFHGGLTDETSLFAIYRHHRNFAIVQKICAKFAERSPRQKLGLEQKGAAGRDVPFARRFVAFLQASGFVHVQQGREDILYVTGDGREVFSRMGADDVPDTIASFLAAN